MVRGAEVGSCCRHVHRSQGGRTGRAGSLRGSQGHASLPSPLEVSKVGLRGVGAEGAGSHPRTLEGQVGRKEGPEGLCTGREPAPGHSPILLPPLHQPAASQSSPFPESCCGSHLLQRPTETLPESSVSLPGSLVTGAQWGLMRLEAPDDPSTLERRKPFGLGFWGGGSLGCGHRRSSDLGRSVPHCLQAPRSKAGLEGGGPTCWLALAARI